MNTQILHFKEAVKNVFGQIDMVLQSLSNEAYCRQSSMLFNATIGQHVRHIIELYIELNKGYECGTVNYEKRERDYKIETDKYFAALLLEDIINKMDKKDKPLVLETGFTINAEDVVYMDTNYYRELAYNIEHTIHHIALIRVGINELSTITVDENFGVAPATIKYRKACAQ